MRKTAAVFALLVFGAACAGSDPVLVEEAEPAGVVVAEVQEAPEEHMEDEGHASEEAHEEGAHEEGAHEEGATEHSEEEMSDPEAMGEPAVELEVFLREFAIKPATLQIPLGGTVRFKVHNEGTEQHEFRLSNHHRVDEHIAAGHEEGHGSEGHHDNADYLFLIEPGETRIVDITFPEGDTETYDLIVCMLPGHFEGGMKLELDYES